MAMRARVDQGGTVKKWWIREFSLWRCLGVPWIIHGMIMPTWCDGSSESHSEKGSRFDQGDYDRILKARTSTNTLSLATIKENYRTFAEVMEGFKVLVMMDCVFSADLL